MTITLHWWLIPIILVVFAIIGLAAAKPTSDWDVVTPLLAIAFSAACLLGAGLFILGHWMN